MGKIVLIHALDGTGPQDGANAETDVYHGNAIEIDNEKIDLKAKALADAVKSAARLYDETE